MATKTTRKTTRRPAKKAATTQVKDTANKVWLAGLGAVAMAEEEGGKLFKGLVSKGKEFEETGREKLGQAQKTVETMAGVARHKVEEATGDVRERATELWARVEDEWDDRMARTLRKFGVPTRSEIARLTRRIEELTQLVEKKSMTARRTRRAASSAKAR